MTARAAAGLGSFFVRRQTVKRVATSWPATDVHQVEDAAVAVADGTPVFTTILVSFPRQTGKNYAHHGLAHVCSHDHLSKALVPAQTGMAALKGTFPLAELIGPSKYLERGS